MLEYMTWAWISLKSSLCMVQLLQPYFFKVQLHFYPLYFLSKISHSKWTHEHTTWIWRDLGMLAHQFLRREGRKKEDDDVYNLYVVGFTKCLYALTLRFNVIGRSKQIHKRRIWSFKRKWLNTIFYFIGNFIEKRLLHAKWLNTIPMSEKNWCKFCGKFHWS